MFALNVEMNKQSGISQKARVKQNVGKESVLHDRFLLGESHGYLRPYATIDRLPGQRSGFDEPFNYYVKMVFSL